MSKHTTNYDMFKYFLCNRKIDRNNVEHIKKSILQENKLHEKPMLVTKDYHIIDGQHRLQAAKELGLEIYYDISEDFELQHIILLNNQKSWEPLDYLNFYCQNNNENYLNIMKVMNNKNCSLRNVIALAFEVDNRALRNEFRDGKIKFDDDKVKIVESILDQVNDLKSHIVSRMFEKPLYTNNAGFQKALSFIIKNPIIDKKILFDRIERCMDKLRVCSSIKEYIKMFCDIYNYHSRNPIDPKDIY